MKIGIIGCGVIGTEIATFLDTKENARIVAVTDIVEEKAKKLISKLRNNRPKISPLEETIYQSEFIIESATPQVVPEILRLAEGKRIFVMSVGGLLDQKISNNVFFPSGAIGGLDALRAASMGKIYSITLTTTKPPRGLKGAPYVVEKGIDVESIERREIFSGSVSDAIRGFPANVNVAASLAISSKQPDKVTVRIIVDKNAKTNTHEIEISSDSGKFHFRFENVPSEQNPKTSKLAILSALSTIQGIIYQQTS